MLDTSLEDVFNIFYFLKKHGNFSIPEMEKMKPFELEIYYYMAVKERKTELGIK